MLLAGAAAAGCRAGDPGPVEDFLSDHPGIGQGDTGTAGGDGETGGDNGGDDGGREISEADIVAIEGDRLYALSRYGGLAVIDVSAPDTALPVLGRYRAHASPFEMYVDADSVFVMYSDWGTYELDDAGGWVWRSSTRLVALDASDPTDIVERGEFEMPGYISDSRRVGDILYLVTHEDGYCWGCDTQVRTVVTSLNVSNPAEVGIVDQLAFVDDEAEYWGWSGQRSVAATDERLYVAGIEYADFDDSHSVIDVVDISDPGGALTAGAAVTVAGQITNRWQMDEYDGVLRVVSQPGLWGSTNAPVIETFTVASAGDITPLGTATMTLPRPEALRSVRFDGPRGYAITFEQVDPLFTLDLSDPANPQQVGELEIPGWVHHMEPRGEDRVIGLGFDPNNPDGALNVSLFDVSDFANPTMLSRVHFGGDWAYLGEDQDRIHKAFSILDDLGLVLVPFSGWEYDGDDLEGCYGSYHSGIQLVDWTDDTLVARGFAASHGEARRALVHRDRLLGMSDKAVESFDITDRDAPTPRAEVALAAHADSVAVADGLVARLSQDWWTGRAQLDLVDVAHAEDPEPLGRLDLSAIVDEGSRCWEWGWWGAELFAHEGYVYLVRERYDETTGEPATRIDVVDARDPIAPAWVQMLDVPGARQWWGYGAGVSVPEARAVLTGDALVLAMGSVDEVGQTLVSSGAFVVVDLTDPGAPTLAAPIERPHALAHGGLQVHDGKLVSWHMRAVESDPSHVRYFLDRLDVTSPSAATLAPAINVPGMVVAYDDDAQRATTVDFRFETRPMSDQECWMQPQVYDYDRDDQQCVLGIRELHHVALHDDHASLLQTIDLEEDTRRMAAVAATGDRLFVHLARGGYWGWGVDGGVAEDGADTTVELPPAEVVTLTGIDADELAIASRTQIAQSGWWLGALTASEHHVVFDTDNGLGVLDTTDPAQPAFDVRETWGYGCWSPVIDDGVVYCPMGEFGLQALPL